MPDITSQKNESSDYFVEEDVQGLSLFLLHYPVKVECHDKKRCKKADDRNEVEQCR